ncbi:adenosylcobinamide amidohydrolase [Candidatus Poriferisodalis sp.]|uniref:adenosylcobinamide amidohydrolase n=1 Tax=Candidatus Poriferisodalis sp. TaxID=3101277 RepID=UPI003B02494E
MSAVVEPTLVTAPRSALVWRFDQPTEVISSAAVGGGIGQIDWIVNIGVGSGYTRTDLDAHAAEVTAELGLRGPGTALFTAVDVKRCSKADCGGVVVHATVGVSKPTWAADVSGSVDACRPGTINIVAQLPVGFEPGAAVNAAMTITEAKTQALAECGVAGTGTATDAVVAAWPAAARRQRFGGPRSEWGQRLALAVRSAVQAGLPAGPA